MVGLIISGEFPLLTQAWTLGPVLCAGNTVVMKPAKENPLTSLHIASLIAEAGFPLGVVNVITNRKVFLIDLLLSDEVNIAMATHHKINNLVFVGSTCEGRYVLRQAGGNILKRKKVTY